MMMRTLVLLLALFTAPLSLAAPPTSGGVKNFLLITVDDMNQDSVGAFGCKVPGATPNIDRLASQGMRFVNAHVNAAICFPSRSVMMTGMYPHHSGGFGFNNIFPQTPTLLEALHNAGFQTGIMAKVPHVVPDRGKAWDMVVDAAGVGAGRNPQLYHDHALKFFQDAKASGKRFFLMANSQDPHRPFIGSEQEKQKAGGKKAAKKADAKGKKGKNAKKAAVDPDDEAGGMTGAAPPTRVYKPEEIVVPAFVPDIPDVRKEIAQYFTSVHRADETVGAVLKALDEAGLADSTLVIFLSDHGLPVPYSKTNCYLTSTRTPLVVRCPAPGMAAPGSVNDRDMVPTIDLAPTALDLLGLPPLPGADGRSFQPLLRGQTQDGREFVFTSINTISSGASYPMRAVQNRNFGYIFNAWSDGKRDFHNESMSGLTWKAMVAEGKDSSPVQARVTHYLHRTPDEFYDYANDPAALRNLVDDPAYKEKVAEFRNRLHEQMKATKDPQLSAFEKLLESKAK